MSCWLSRHCSPSSSHRRIEQSLSPLAWSERFQLARSFLRLLCTVVDLIFTPIDQDSFAFAMLAIHLWFIGL